MSHIFDGWKKTKKTSAKHIRIRLLQEGGCVKQHVDSRCIQYSMCRIKLDFLVACKSVVVGRQCWLLSIHLLMVLVCSKMECQSHSWMLSSNVYTHHCRMTTAAPVDCAPARNIESDSVFPGTLLAITHNECVVGISVLYNICAYMLIRL